MNEAISRALMAPCDLCTVNSSPSSSQLKLAIAHAIHEPNFALCTEYRLMPYPYSVQCWLHPVAIISLCPNGKSCGSHIVLLSRVRHLLVHPLSPTPLVVTSIFVVPYCHPASSYVSYTNPIIQQCSENSIQIMMFLHQPKSRRRCNVL
jgi:hypothetical protein